MLFSKRVLILIISISLLLTGCFNQYSEEISTVEKIAQQINEDLILLEEEILKGGLSFEALNDLTLTHHQVFKMSQQYEMTPYGLFYNPNAIESSGVLTGYQPIDYLLKKRLYKTEVLEKVLIHSYNNHALVDQAYYLEGNGLLRVYPSIRVTDNITPRTNFFDIRIFDTVMTKIEGNLKWFLVPYLNPSGRQWVISLFNPVYSDDVLQGVFGFDIVASNFEKHYLEKDMMLFNSEGDIISVDASLYQLLNIKGRANDIYYEEIMVGKLADQSYNLKKNKIKKIRELYSRVINGESSFTIQLNRQYFVIAKKVERIDSYLVKLIEDK